MKIILLVLIICLLIKTLKGIPVVFSNIKLNKQLLDIKESMDKMKDKTYWTEEETNSFMIIFTYIIAFIFSIIYLILYSYIKELPILILTIINLCQTFLIDIQSTKYAIKNNYTAYGKLYSCRLYRIINLIINLSYFGFAIYYLFMMIINK